MLTNKANINLCTAVWLAADEYQFKPNWNQFSATGLLKSAKSIILSYRYKEQTGSLVQDVTDLVPSRMGTALHTSVELAWSNVKIRTKAMDRLGIPSQIQKQIALNPGIDGNPALQQGQKPLYMEVRGQRKIDKTVISGQPDFVWEGQVQDLKSTKVYNWIHGGNDEKYMMQGSIYRWIMPDIITQASMQVNFIFTDWNPLEAQRKASDGYPQFAVGQRTLELMPAMDIELWLKQKLNTIYRYKDVPEVDMPPCTPEEVWQREGQWAYYKKPEAKRATKLFDSKAEAELFQAQSGGGGRIEERPGEVKFCTYCNGRPICQQAEKYIQQGLLKI